MYVCVCVCVCVCNHASRSKPTAATHVQKRMRRQLLQSQLPQLETVTIATMARGPSAELRLAPVMRSGDLRVQVVRIVGLKATGAIRA
jgi:hypothetical protein